jgi:DegV family protein with EDD domain
LRSGANSKTSILNVQAHVDLFTDMAKRGIKNAIHFTQTRGLSPTIDNANAAIEIVKKDYPDINYVAVSSNTTTVGEGIVVRVACRMRDEGKSMEETIAHINEIKDKIQHLVIVDDLQFLKRGGRISSVQATFGTILQVKPIIEMTKEGKLEVVRKERGIKKAMKSVVEEAGKYGKNDDFMAVIAHTDNPEGAQELQDMMFEAYDYRPEIRIIGPIVGTHLGPNALALAFISATERPY